MDLEQKVKILEKQVKYLNSAVLYLDHITKIQAKLIGATGALLFVLIVVLAFRK